MRTVIAFNGSPRKRWNTAQMVRSAAAGATAQGAAVEMVHLYDLRFKGCASCFACKLKGGKSYGRCALRDGLSPLLRKIEKAAGIIIGSPFYLGAESAQTRALLERLLFPFFTYTDPPRSLFPGKLRAGLIFTCGATQDMFLRKGWDRHASLTERFATLVFGEARSVYAYDTCQFDDYSRYETSRFDPAHKAKRREEQFPRDLRQAFELGVWLATR